MGREERVSSYLEHLPAVLQEGPFIGRFLLAFEAILHGLPPGPDVSQLPVGLSDLLDRMHTYFDPVGERTVAGTRMPAEFLPWLAQWMATSLWEDWSEETKRNFLANCLPFYRRRGTRGGPWRAAPRGPREGVGGGNPQVLRVVEAGGGPDQGLPPEPKHRAARGLTR